MQAISRSPLPRHTGFFGGHSEEVPPVPIPNTEVKLFSADGTAWETMWESRSPPNSLKKAPARSRAQGLFLFPFVSLLPLIVPPLPHPLHDVWLLLQILTAQFFRNTLVCCVFITFIYPNIFYSNKTDYLLREFLWDVTHLFLPSFLQREKELE